MNFIEFLGFVISFAAMIFLFIKRFLEENKRRRNPEEYARKEREREENLRKFLRSVEIHSHEKEDEEDEEEDEEDFLPQPPAKHSKSPLIYPALNRLPKVEKKTAPAPTPPLMLGNYGRETASDKKHQLANSQSYYDKYQDFKPAESYEVIRSETFSPASKLIDRLHSRSEMLIIKEIFDPPLSMRNLQDK